MREILFRGKRIDNGEWVYGFYAALPDCVGIVHMIETPKANPDETNVTYFVDPSTVGQYTGINGCHKAKIFEGDILEGLYFNPDNGYGTVEFDNGAFTVENSSATATFHENIWGREVEIIGNIHDNPELLEEVSDNG